MNFEIKDVAEVRAIIPSHPELKGLNVTIPHKEAVIPYLDELTPEAKKIGAVNTIRVGETLIGHNTDYIGFMNSLTPLLNYTIHQKALILGTGGASKAVAHALTDLGLEWKYVSRSRAVDRLGYEELTADVLSQYTVIINATPLGTYPNVDTCPAIPYEHLTENHLLYDLVYNPEVTLFLSKGKEQGAMIKNGKEMLELQALAAWEFWNQ